MSDGAIVKTKERKPRVLPAGGAIRESLAQNTKQGRAAEKASAVPAEKKGQK